MLHSYLLRYITSLCYVMRHHVSAMVVGSISNRENELFSFSNSGNKTKRSIKFRYATRNIWSRERSVLTLGSPCSPWCMRNTALSYKKIITIQLFHHNFMSQSTVTLTNNNCYTIMKRSSIIRALQYAHRIFRPEVAKWRGGCGGFHESSN